MKKRYYLYILIATFFIAYFYTALIYSGHWFKMEQGFSSVSILGYFLWFIFAFYFTLTLHELGHFFAFHFQGVKLRALYLTIFVFYKNEKGWRFTVRPKLWVLFGGLVVPELGEIKSDKEFLILKEKFAKSLITAPVVTIVVLVLTLISFGFVLHYSQNTLLIGILALNSIYITLFSLLYIYTFTISNQMFYGDFVAYKKIKEDYVFQLATINQYVMFSLTESKDTTKFLWEKTRECLIDIKINSSDFHSTLLLNYLEGVINLAYDLDATIDKKIRKLNIRAYTKSEQGLLLLYEICNYFYKIKEVEKAYQMFERIDKSVSPKLDSKMVLYFKRRSSHQLHIEYFYEFLKNEANYHIGHAWIFDVLVDPYEMLKAQNEVLPFVEYVCEVNLELDKDESDTNKKES